MKSNIGHLEVAAGVAGLIKAACAVRDGRIPPTLHFSTPNPAIDLATTPFFVPIETRPWAACAGLRRAGVSSFGVGGTNAHVVLEEPPGRAPRQSTPAPLDFIASAPTEAALRATAGALAATLRSRPGLDASDVAFTLREGRRRMAAQLAVRADSVAAFAAALERRRGRRRDSAPGRRCNPRIPRPPCASAADRARSPATLDRACQGGLSRFGARPRSAMAGAASEAVPQLQRIDGDAAGMHFVKRIAANDPWLVDHCRDGVPVLPGAAVILLARAAAAAALASPTVVLESLAWRRMLQRGDDGLTVEIEVADGSRGDAVVRLREPGGTVAAEAQATTRERPRPAALDMAGIAQRCTGRFDVDRLYDAFAQRGFVYGAAFRRLTDIAVGSDECLARLAPADVPIAGDAGAFDAAMQAAFPLLGDDDVVWIPAGVGRTTLCAPDDRAALVHVRRTARDQDLFSAVRYRCRCRGPYPGGDGRCPFSACRTAHFDGDRMERGAARAGPRMPAR